LLASAKASLINSRSPNVNVFARQTFLNAMATVIGVVFCVNRLTNAALEPRPDELVVNKTTYGTFNSTGLDHALRSLGITSLVVGGVVTNVCVETTARDAADRGYDVVVLDDGSAAFSPEIHEATLLSFQGPFGRVRTSDEVLALLEAGAPARR
jgi:isochorismate hydrolase